MEPIIAGITVGDGVGTDDPFGAMSSFTTSDGSSAAFMDIGTLEREGGYKLDNLPISIRILLEAALRKCDGFLVTEDDVRHIAAWSPTMTPEEIPFSPSLSLIHI